MSDQPSKRTCLPHGSAGGVRHGHPGRRSLLPNGLMDLLPPDAEAESRIVEALLNVFALNGYDRVKPPLIEFEDGLLGGPGAVMAESTFRVMDPVSGRMMAVRPDMTMQVARIAATRLAKQPRPLRLSYAGEVLMVRGSQLRPERQFGQVGAELIGASEPAADAEVIILAAEALTTIGIGSLTIDLTAPQLVPALLAQLGVSGEGRNDLMAALEGRDEAAVAVYSHPLGEASAWLLKELVTTAGRARDALRKLKELPLTGQPAALVEHLEAVVGRVRAAWPSLSMTIDPLENRGFEYHSGVSFTLFAPGVRGELGRGGRYQSDAGETATGLTLYTDSLRRAVDCRQDSRRCYVPWEAPPETGPKLRNEGWTTIAALTASADPIEEAKRMGCAACWNDGLIVSLD